MPDFRGEVFPLSIDVFRVVAPRLTRWEVLQPSLPCWRLWWNSNAGASVTWRGAQTELTPSKFVLVAPETELTVELRRPVERHLFIHFGLTADWLRVTDRVLIVPADLPTRRKARALAHRLPSRFIGIGDPLAGAALVCSVLARMDRRHWTAPVADPRIARVQSTFESSLSHSWSNAKMARVAAMSTGGFVRLFRRVTGMAPQQYVLHQRLALARNLLLQTNLSIEEITDRCGFCDRSYFSAVFRRGIGMPPAQFRRQGKVETNRPSPAPHT